MKRTTHSRIDLDSATSDELLAVENDPTAHDAQHAFALQTRLARRDRAASMLGSAAHHEALAEHAYNALPAALRWRAQ